MSDIENISLQVPPTDVARREEIEPTAELRVSVTSADGLVVVGALAYGILPSELRGLGPIQGRTDRAGITWLTPPRRAEPYSIIVGVHADGYVPVVREHVLIPATLEVPFVLDRGLSISGVVRTADDRAIGVRTIRASTDSSFDRDLPFLTEDMRADTAKLIQGPAFAHRRSSTTTDTDGRFEVSGLLPGRYWLVLDDPDWILEPTRQLEAGTSDAVLTAVPGTRLAVVCRDSDTNAAIESFRCEVSMRGRSQSSGLAKRRVMVAGADGDRFQMQWTIPKEWADAVTLEVTAIAAGYQPGAKSLTLQRGQEERIELSLQRLTTVRISLAFRWSDGDPWQGRAAFRCLSPGPWLGWTGDLTSVGTGVYHLEVPAGRWRMRFWPEQLLASSCGSECVIDTAKTTHYAFVSPPAGAVMLHFPPRMIGSGWHVELLGPRHGVVRSIDSDERMMRGLEPGRWVFRCVHPGQDPMEQVVHIEAGTFEAVVFS